MKKILWILLFGMQLFSSHLFGQDGGSSPNESWNIGTYGEPENWYSSNHETLTRYNLISVSKVPGIKGFGVLLQTYIKDHDTVKAFISNTRGNATKGQGGIPFTEKVVGMHGYYNYDLVDDDTARLLIVFKRKDTIVSITNYKIRGDGKLQKYTPFTIPISLDVVPDTLIIEATLQSYLSSPGRKEGSMIAFDSLYFIGIGKMIPFPNGNFENWALHRRN